MKCVECNLPLLFPDIAFSTIVVIITLEFETKCCFDTEWQYYLYINV